MSSPSHSRKRRSILRTREGSEREKDKPKKKISFSRDDVLSSPIRAGRLRPSLSPVKSSGLLKSSVTLSSLGLCYTPPEEAEISLSPKGPLESMQRRHGLTSFKKTGGPMKILVIGGLVDSDKFVEDLQTSDQKENSRMTFAHVEYPSEEDVMSSSFFLFILPLITEASYLKVKENILDVKQYVSDLSVKSLIVSKSSCEGVQGNASMGVDCRQLQEEMRMISFPWCCSSREVRTESTQRIRDYIEQYIKGFGCLNWVAACPEIDFNRMDTTVSSLV